jgi:hypothetical protein
VPASYAKSINKKSYADVITALNLKDSQIEKINLKERVAKGAMRFSLFVNIRQAGPVVFITKIRLKYAVQYIDYAQRKCVIKQGIS